MSAIQRILDANLNRAREGLRVAEEIARLVAEDAAIQHGLKKVRQALARLEQRQFGWELIRSRDVRRDPGIETRGCGETRRRNFRELARANFRRVQEALRVMEEILKFSSLPGSEAFKRLRFQTYNLEQALDRRLSHGARTQPKFSKKGRRS